jgi:4-amino-4-deoxy-L-arabinose transferase-like glycosyltransferase
MHLSGLGIPSLWDIDEGKNSEAAREMLDSDNWVVPTFNYEPRYEKPVLLYWLQATAYGVFGITEFSARLPCALACCLAGLMVYELGRRLFNAETGLLAALILSSMAFFCASARFANPDALLNTFTLLTLTFFWFGFSSRSAVWLLAAGVSSGLAVLAKGPVGLVMPSLVTVCFLLGSRQAGFLRNRGVFWGSLAFVATALPWYLWVSVDTKGAFLKAFFLKENVSRFLDPMEHHSGPPFYYLGVLVIGLAPWCVFLGPVVWYSLGKRAASDVTNPAGSDGLPIAYRFLWIWIVLYLVIFSFARTKLPNYVLPVYAPIALLTARFLQRWRTRAIAVPGWAITTAFVCFFLVGLTTSFGLLFAGGVLPFPAVSGGSISGVGVWAGAGFIPMSGAVLAWRYWYRDKLQRMLACTVITAMLFLGLLLIGASISLDKLKAPRALVETAAACDEYHEVRIGAYQYFQPSLVFYCRREVKCLDTEEKTLEFLRCPLPVFLFMPAEAWEDLRTKVRIPARLLARQFDLYRHCEVVVVTNH